MRYRYSLNEVQRLSQKAAEGAGIPAGLDVDIAQQVACLSSYEFPVFGSFITALERANDATTYRLQADTFSAKNKSGVLIAMALIDVLVAKASSVTENTTNLTITDLSTPVFLLPNAISYSADGWYFTFQIKQQEQSCFVFTISSGEESEITLFRSLDSNLDSSALCNEQRFTIECYCGRQKLKASSLPILISDSMLKDARAHSLSQGILIDDDTYKRLNHHAVKVLVPATEKSRLHGAGAITDNNH